MLITNQIEIPTATLVKETVEKDAKKVVKFAEVVKNLATSEIGELLKVAMEVKRKGVACSKAGTSEATALEATRGKSPSHTTSDSIIELDSSSPSTNSYKAFTPSPSNQTSKQPDDVDTLEPKSIDERISSLVDQRLGLCKKLPADHWFIPEFARPLQTVTPCEPDQVASDIPTSTSSQPQPSTQTIDSSILDELPNHYKGELPGFKPNSEKASEIAPDVVVLESPQHQQPNS